MKKITIFILNLLLISLSINAQKIVLKGVVSIQNSEYETGTREYVQGATISTDSASDEITGGDGKFMFEFAENKIGDSIRLKVDKPGWEVVNEKDLIIVITGQTIPLKIHLCKEGELADNHVKYYQIKTIAKQLIHLKRQLVIIRVKMMFIIILVYVIITKRNFPKL